MLKYQRNPVQHLINRSAKNADIIEVKQESQVLLVSQTHLHEMTETSTCIAQTERHSSKLI